MKREICLFGAALSLSLASTMAQPTYEARLGLYGPEHTNNLGKQYSELSGVSGDFFRGSSRRYNGTSAWLGDSAWIAHSTGQTVQVGLTGGLFGSITTTQTSAVQFLNASGASAGRSAYLPSGVYAGDAAWVANSAGVTTQVGLYNSPLYTSNDGYRLSTVSGLSSAGFAWGYSDIYNSGASAIGQGAWIATATGVTARVGFTSAPYIRTDGAQSSVINGINVTGATVGYSNAYSGNSDRGHVGWTALSNGTTVVVGQYDAIHTRTDGYRFTEAQFISDAGYVAGYSKLYSGMASRGQTAWRVAPSGTLTQLGFVGSEYSDGGTFESSVTGLTSTGEAIGYSVRNASGGFASTGWVASTGGTITNVGLTGTGYTNVFGFSSNRPELVTDTGFVAGSTSRYSPNYAGTAVFMHDLNSGTAVRVGLYGTEQINSFGETDNRLLYLKRDGSTAGYSAGDNFAWVADASGNSHQIGETGAAFTNGSGGHLTTILGMTESGYIWGSSARAAGGEAGWLFSLDNLDQISLADYDIVAPSGYGTSSFLGVNGDGTAYGFYYVHDASGLTNSRIAFIYNATEGFVPVGPAIGDIEQYGWEAFESAYMTESGIIAGRGSLSDGSTGIYMATVPEPSALALAAVALAILVVMRRGRTRKTITSLILMAPMVSCQAQTESVDDLKGICDILLNAPLATIENAKWSGFKVDHDYRISQIVASAREICEQRSRQPSDTTGGDLSINCSGGGIKLLGEPIKRVHLSWCASPVDFRTPLIESVTAYFEQPAAGTAAVEFFRNRFGPPSTDGRWRGKSVELSAYGSTTSGSVTIRAPIQAQLAAAIQKREAAAAKLSAEKMPKQGLN